MLVYFDKESADWLLYLLNTLEPTISEGQKDIAENIINQIMEGLKDYERGNTKHKMTEQEVEEAWDKLGEAARRSCEVDS